MRTRRLGNSDLELTPVGFGTWAIGGGEWGMGWGQQEEKDSKTKSKTTRQNNFMCCHLVMQNPHKAITNKIILLIDSHMSVLSI